MNHNIKRLLAAALFCQLAATISSLRRDAYCQITPKHTACKYTAPSPKCGDVITTGLTAAEKRQVLNLHNKYRQTVANGQERRGVGGPQPSASNMRELEWDEELASIAQMHSEDCRFGHDCLTCRKVPRFYVGQNLYQTGEFPQTPDSNWPKAISAWYEEAADWNPRHIYPFKFIKPLGHYTQMMWAETTKIGCGYVHFKQPSNLESKKLYVCNYGDAGNVLEDPMYKVGAPCSECPEGTSCSGSYPGLCSSRGGGSAYNSYGSANAIQPTVTRQTYRPTPTTTALPTRTTTAYRNSVFNYNNNQNAVNNRINTNTNSVFSFNNRFHQTANKFTTTPTKIPNYYYQRASTTTSTSSPYYNQDTNSIFGFHQQGPSDVYEQNAPLFQCDFDTFSCNVKWHGVLWSRRSENGRGQFYESSIGAGLSSILSPKGSVQKPNRGSNICVSFEYRKTSRQGHTRRQSAYGDDIPVMKVSVGPLGGNIQEQEYSLEGDTQWTGTSLDFAGIRSEFAVSVEIINQSAKTISFAVDNFRVTSGRC